MQSYEGSPLGASTNERNHSGNSISIFRVQSRHTNQTKTEQKKQQQQKSVFPDLCKSLFKKCYDNLCAAW